MSDERENTDSKSDDQRISIGRIPLKQVRVAKKQKASNHNPMNMLVPYLDLFSRLGDAELSRLAGVTEEIVAELRKQVVTIDQALCMYADLLPRLADEELVRLTGATPKTIRFWRLCQPRVPTPSAARAVSPSAQAAAPAPVPAQAAAPQGSPSESSGVGIVARAAAANATTAPVPTVPKTAVGKGTEAADVPKTRQQREAAAPTAAPPIPTPPPPPASSQPAAAASGDAEGDRPKAKDTQQAAARLMSFSGDPFPGFDDSAVGFEGVPNPDELEVALEDLEDAT